MFTVKSEFKGPTLTTVLNGTWGLYSQGYRNPGVASRKIFRSNNEDTSSLAVLLQLSGGLVSGEDGGRWRTVTDTALVHLRGGR